VNLACKPDLDGLAFDVRERVHQHDGALNGRHRAPSDQAAPARGAGRPGMASVLSIGARLSKALLSACACARTATASDLARSSIG
jgi:hypothetical protein